MPEPSRGLAPFDEPVYLQHANRTASGDLVPPDAAAHPVVAFLARSCLVAALAGVVPFLTDQDVRMLLAAAVCLHLPVTTALDLHRRGTEGHRRRAAGVLVTLDVLLLATLSSLAESSVILGTAGLLAIAFHRWLYGRGAGVLSVVLVAACLISLVGVGRVDSEWFSVLSVVVVGSLLVWLVDDQAMRQTQTSEGLELVATRAEAVLEGIGDAIVSTDGDGDILELNRAATGLLGCPSDAVRGQPCSLALGLRTEAGLIDCTDGCSLLVTDGAAVEVRRTGPQGNRQPLLVSAVALRGPDGQILEIVHLLRDITSIKQADEAKTLFLATASHEFKTPLAVIRGYAQLLRTPGIDPVDHHQAIEAIEARSMQLLGIVDRLLMSSRIESGRIELVPRLVQVADVLHERATAYSDAHRALEIRIPPDLPAALAEESALATAVDHLLENADKYSPGGTTISLEADHDDERVAIRVSDHGIGMTQEQMARCFDRFWQAEGTDVRRFGGTGIGLYIVRSLVDAMHGSVSVAANDDRGMTFTISLRRHPVEPDVAPIDPDSRADATEGEESMIREFMRQVGVLSEAGEG